MSNSRKPNNITGSLFLPGTAQSNLSGAGASYTPVGVVLIRDFYLLVSEVCLSHGISVSDVFNAFLTAFITGDIAIKPSVVYATPDSCRSPITNPHAYMPKFIDRSGNVINPSPLTEEHIDIYQGTFYLPSEWRSAEDGGVSANSEITAPYLKNPNNF